MRTFIKAFAYRWFIGHRHKWEAVDRIPTYVSGLIRPIKYEYVMECQECGKLKKFKV